MTPKEKAIELVSKMCLNDCTDKNIKLAKQLSLIAVDEILKVEFYTTDEIYNYYLEVKQEIEKL